MERVIGVIGAQRKDVNTNDRARNDNHGSEEITESLNSPSIPTIAHPGHPASGDTATGRQLMLNAVLGPFMLVQSLGTASVSTRIAGRLYTVNTSSPFPFDRNRHRYKTTSSLVSQSTPVYTYRRLNVTNVTAYSHDSHSKASRTHSILSRQA